jgi:hypothetical protein
MTTSSRRRSASRGYAPCSTRDSGASGSWVDLGLILVRVSCVRTHTDTLSHAHRLPWRLLVCVLLPPGVSSRTGKTPGEPGHTRDTHGTHTGHAGAQRHTDHADEPHNHPNPPTTHIPHVSGRQRDDRSRGRLNSHRPGADRSPRPAQYRRTVYIWDACEVRLCDTCARVRPCVPSVSRVKRNRGSRDTFYR